MLSRLCFMNKRASDGKVSLNEYGHLSRSQFLAHTPEEKKVLFNHGGHGLFGRPSEYLQIISMLLNDGTYPKTGNKILEKETVDEMFTNQIPQFPDFGRQIRLLPPCIPSFSLSSIHTILQRQSDFLIHPDNRPIARRPDEPLLRLLPGAQQSAARLGVNLLPSLYRTATRIPRVRPGGQVHRMRSGGVIANAASEA